MYLNMSPILADIKIFLRDKTIFFQTKNYYKNIDYVIMYVIMIQIRQLHLKLRHRTLDMIGKF